MRGIGQAGAPGQSHAWLLLKLNQIVPKHSAIISAYGNCAIHSNHTDIARYSNKDDAGYEAISGQLWLWANEIEEEKKARKAISRNPDSELLRVKRETRFGHNTYSGKVDSGGGSDLQGNQIDGNFVLNC